MNWAIIVFSSFVGAGAIVTQLPLGQKISAIVFVVLVIIGITVQARLMKRSRKSEA
jgi:membrane protein implicated in regulation of membrane protease activity